MADEVINQGLSRVLYQFKGSTNFLNFLTTFLTSLQEIYDVNDDLLNNRNILTAENAQLDGIGEIEGLERPRIYDGDVEGFGFDGDPTAQGFSSLTYPDSGGNLVSLSIATRPATDDEYRIALKARASENSSNLTVEKTLRTLSFVLGSPQIRYMLPSNLNPVYVIAKTLSTYDVYLLGRLALTLGISNAEFISYTAGPLETYVYTP